jgi:hypothetical protein
MWHLLRMLTGDTKWERIDKFIKPSETKSTRFCFPCFMDYHFTLTLFDVPPQDGRKSGRLCFIDSLEYYRQEISNAFHGFYSYRKFKNLSICNIRGGMQGKNMTECGIFCMQNMEAALATKPFFDLGEWTSSANDRSLEGCETARIHYSSLLREFSIRWMRSGTPVSLQAVPSVIEQASAEFLREQVSDAVAVSTPFDIAEQVSSVPVALAEHIPVARTSNFVVPPVGQIVISSDDEQPHKLHKKGHHIALNRKSKIDSCRTSRTIMQPQLGEIRKRKQLQPQHDDEDSDQQQRQKPQPQEQQCINCDTPLGKGHCRECYFTREHPPSLPSRRSKEKKQRVISFFMRVLISCRLVTYLK